MLTFGSLFAGIGGFDLGFERAGMVCKWQVEIDPYCQRVLAKYWPNVKRYDDVRTFPPAGDWGVDVICGGFPCQDISNAGKRAGIDGEKSGLWREFSRVVRVLRPRFVAVENVAAITIRGLERVLGDLAEGGYDAEWSLFSAKSVGSPQRGRDRCFLVAYPAQLLSDGSQDNGRCRTQGILAVSKPGDGRSAGIQFAGNWESAQPGVLRVADGVPDWVDRLAALGNAVVPQVAEWIGRRIVEAAEQSR